VSTDHIQRNRPPRDEVQLPLGGVKAVRSPGRREPAKNQFQPHYQINWLLLAGTVVAFLVLAPSAYFWHGYQVRRNGSAFLEHAIALEDDGKWTEAAEELHSYIRLFPKDKETDQVRIRLAKTFDLGATSGMAKVRAIELYATAFGLEPERIDLRRRQAELEFELGRIEQSLEHANDVLKIEPTDPLALRLKAQATYLVHRDRPSLRTSRVDEYYLDALQHAKEPSDAVTLTLQLAQIYRDSLERLKQPGEPGFVKSADDLIEKMVVENPESVDAFVGRYEYRRRYNVPAADADLDRALALDKNHRHVAANLLAGDRANGRKQLDAAMAHYGHAIAADPKDPRGYLGLGTMHAQRGDLKQAVKVYGDGLKEVPTYSAFLLHALLCKTLLNDGRLAETAEQLALLEEQVNDLAARNPGTEANLQRTSVQTLRGQWHMQRGEFLPAIDVFKNALTNMSGPGNAGRGRTESQLEINMLLGRCWLNLRKWTPAALAFTEATKLAPNSLEANLSAARAFQAVQRPDEAIRFYEQAVKLPDCSESAWVGLTETKLLQLAGRSAENRDWPDLEATLQKGQEAYPDSVGLKSLEARMAELRGESGQTLELLEKAYAKSPKSPQLAEQLMIAYDRAQRTADADRVLREFESQNDGKDSAHIGILLRSTLLTNRGQLDVAEKLLRDRLPTVPPTVQPLLKYRLVDLLWRTNRIAETRRELTELAESMVGNQTILVKLAELALNARDMKDLEQWELKLLEQEGPNGTTWRYFRAQRLLTEVKSVKDPSFLEAQKLSEEIRGLRPDWSDGLVLQGQIAQILNDPAAAIAAYQSAIDHGMRRASVYTQLAALLYSTNRIVEADDYLKRMGKNAEDSPQLAKLAIPAHLRTGDLERAVEIARKQVKNHPNEPSSQAWLGHSLLAANKKAEAEAAFRRAVELGPTDLPSWMGLFSFYARTDQLAAARETLEKMPETLNVPEEKRAFLLAQGYEVLGDREAARSHFLKAAAAAPNDAIVHDFVARFFASENNFDQALVHQNRALELVPKSGVLRRKVVVLLIKRGDAESLNRALGLVGGDTVVGQLDVEDQRLRAEVFLRKGGAEGRTQARSLLKAVTDAEKSLPADRMRLAHMLENDGLTGQAIEEAFLAASRKDASVQHVATYADMLLRNKRADEVAPWAERLVKEAPNAFPTVWIRARWLSDTGRRNEVEPLLEAFLKQRLSEAKSKPETASALLAVGNLYDQVSLDAAAERCYRELVTTTTNGYVPLAKWLARHQRVDEAISLCVQAASTDSSTVPAITLAGTLIAGKATSKEAERAETYLSQAIASHADDPDLLFTVATLRLLTGNRDEAVTMLRKVIALQPKNVLARNNLASLLAENAADRKEALKLIDEAIEIDGQSVELLDTKGMILLRDNKLSEATEFLREAAKRPPYDPRHLFHLALSYQKAGELDKAGKTLQSARDRSLTTTLLSPDERELLTKLERDLGR